MFQYQPNSNQESSKNEEQDLQKKDITKSLGLEYWLRYGQELPQEDENHILSEKESGQNSSVAIQKAIDHGPNKLENIEAPYASPEVEKLPADELFPDDIERIKGDFQKVFQNRIETWREQIFHGIFLAKIEDLQSQINEHKQPGDVFPDIVVPFLGNLLWAATVFIPPLLPFATTAATATAGIVFGVSLVGITIASMPDISEYFEEHDGDAYSGIEEYLIQLNSNIAEELIELTGGVADDYCTQFLIPIDTSQSDFDSLVRNDFLVNNFGSENLTTGSSGIAQLDVDKIIFDAKDVCTQRMTKAKYEAHASNLDYEYPSTATLAREYNLIDELINKFGLLISLSRNPLHIDNLWPDESYSEPEKYFTLLLSILENSLSDFGAKFENIDLESGEKTEYDTEETYAKFNLYASGLKTHFLDILLPQVDNIETAFSGYGDEDKKKITMNYYIAKIQTIYDFLSYLSDEITSPKDFHLSEIMSKFFFIWDTKNPLL